MNMFLCLTAKLAGGSSSLAAPVEVPALTRTGPLAQEPQEDFTKLEVDF